MLESQLAAAKKNDAPSKPLCDTNEREPGSDAEAKLNEIVDKMAAEEAEQEQDAQEEDEQETDEQEEDEREEDEPEEDAQEEDPHEEDAQEEAEEGKNAWCEDYQASQCDGWENWRDDEDWDKWEDEEWEEGWEGWDEGNWEEEKPVAACKPCQPRPVATPARAAACAASKEAAASTLANAPTILNSGTHKADYMKLVFWTAWLCL